MRERAKRCRLVLNVLVVVLVTPVLAVAETDRAGSVLVRHARLIDGRTVEPRAPVSILIRDGRITQIDAEIDAPGTPVLDVAGATVIPGLIDAHVHLNSVPGSEVRHDPPDRQRALRAEQLRSYLASGVTTVLDAAIPAADAREIRDLLSADHATPTVFMLGPPIAAAGGYGSHGPGVPVATTEDLDRLLDVIVGLGAIGVKIPLERGFGSDAIFAIHSPEMRATIARKAADRGLPMYVHASDEVEQTLGLEMGARGLMHLNFAGTPPSREFVDRAVRSGAYMVTTFSCIDAGLVRWQPQRLDDPVVQQTVPADAGALPPTVGLCRYLTALHAEQPAQASCPSPSACAIVSTAGSEPVDTILAVAARRSRPAGRRGKPARAAASAFPPSAKPRFRRGTRARSYSQAEWPAARRCTTSSTSSTDSRTRAGYLYVPEFPSPGFRRTAAGLGRRMFRAAPPTPPAAHWATSGGRRARRTV